MEIPHQGRNIFDSTLRIIGQLEANDKKNPEVLPAAELDRPVLR